jgi:pyrimidine operon attenuation protein/uracil phosphoribosyltransferase
MRVLLDAAALGRGLTRVAGQIAERHPGLAGLVLVGVRRGGTPVAEQLLDCLQRLEPTLPALGTVDITLYRDDASSALPNPRIGPSDIPFGVDGKVVLLVDDVISTGRTARAALDAVLDYGRPRRIELFTVIDRGGRELPLQPDYLVQSCNVPDNERIDVVSSRDGLLAVVQPVGAPSIVPSPPEGAGQP